MSNAVKGAPENAGNTSNTSKKKETGNYKECIF